MDDRLNPLERFLDNIGYAIFCFALAVPGLRELALMLLPEDTDAPWMDSDK